MPTDGLSAPTDYLYDPLGQLTQTLGPPHYATIDGVAKQIRSGSWTYYDDADWRRSPGKACSIPPATIPSRPGFRGAERCRRQRDGRYPGHGERRHMGGHEQRPDGDPPQQRVAAYPLRDHQRPHLHLHLHRLEHGPIPAGSARLRAAIYGHAGQRPGQRRRQLQPNRLRLRRRREPDGHGGPSGRRHGVVYQRLRRGHGQLQGPDGTHRGQSARLHLQQPRAQQRFVLRRVRQRGGGDHRLLV